MNEQKLKKLTKIKFELAKLAGKVGKLDHDLFSFRNMIGYHKQMEKDLEMATKLLDAVSNLLGTEIAGEVEKLRAKQEPGKTITRQELQRLSVLNSEKIPDVVNDNGVLKKFVGIGWIDLDEKPTGKEVRVIDDRVEEGSAAQGG